MAFLALWERIFGPTCRQAGPPTAAHLRMGIRGETIARRYLRRSGYRVLAQNVRIGKHDEIDLVAYDPRDSLIVFVEVKTRAIDHPDFAPELGLTYQKRRRISRAARRWVSSRGYEGGYRLDLVCVAGGAVTAHYEDLEWA